MRCLKFEAEVQCGHEDVQFEAVLRLRINEARFLSGVYLYVQLLIMNEEGSGSHAKGKRLPGTRTQPPSPTASAEHSALAGDTPSPSDNPDTFAATDRPAAALIRRWEIRSPSSPPALLSTNPLAAVTL